MNTGPETSDGPFVNENHHKAVQKVKRKVLGLHVGSPHDYGPLVWEQDWFKKDFTRETLLDDYWRDSWAYLIEEKISPLLMGEWGGFIDKEHDPTGDNTKWMTILRDYMIEKRIHHTFWCFNENSGDTGGLLTNDFQKWDEDKYALVKPALWQDENGKFISLDHQVPMGKSGNGISLSDYYKGSSGPKVEPTTPTTEPTTTTEAPKTILYGDANCSGDVKMNDAVLIMQAVANPDLYDVGGTAESALTPDGYKNADCYDPGSSLTSKDALSVQKALIGTITLPETE